MDPAVTAAVVAAGAAIVGPPVTWLLTRRKVDAAQVELTEAQAEQIRGQVWASLNDTLRAELIRLQGRITDLESRLASLDRALRETSVELAATQAERDSLRTQLAVARARLEAREQEVADLKAALLASTGAQPTPST